MAEVLGIAAGAAGLAGFAVQCLDSAQKTKDFLSGVKNAPKNLSLLLDEIQVTSALIADTAKSEQQRQQQDLQLYSLATGSSGHPQTTSIQVVVLRATGFCQQASVQLEGLLKGLNDGLQRKGLRQRFAPLNYMLHKTQVEQGLQRLERAKSLLSLAQQCLLQ